MLSMGAQMSVDPGGIIKAVTDAVRPIAETLGDGWYALVGDKVAAYRIKNAIQIQSKVNAELAKAGVKLNEVVPEIRTGC